MRTATKLAKIIAQESVTASNYGLFVTTKIENKKNARVFIPTLQRRNVNRRGKHAILMLDVQDFAVHLKKTTLICLLLLSLLPQVLHASFVL